MRFVCMHQCSVPHWSLVPVLAVWCASNSDLHLQRVINGFVVYVSKQFSCLTHPLSLHLSHIFWCAPLYIFVCQNCLLALPVLPPLRRHSSWLLSQHHRTQNRDCCNAFPLGKIVLDVSRADSRSPVGMWSPAHILKRMEWNYAITLCTYTCMHADFAFKCNLR